MPGALPSRNAMPAVIAVSSCAMLSMRAWNATHAFASAPAESSKGTRNSSRKTSPGCIGGSFLAMCDTPRILPAWANAGQQIRRPSDDPIHDAMHFPLQPISRGLFRDPVDDRDRLGHRARLGGRVARHGLALLAGIVEIVRRAGIERRRHERAGIDGALGDMLANLGRDLLVVAAKEEREPRCGGDHILEQRLASAAGIEGASGAEAALGTLPDHHVERRRAAVRPALEKNAVGVDIAASTQKAKPAFRI